ncbi:Maf family protein [Actinomyces polynesiensis]|uniref:Maf family protein n=1 Tax=Actinomyces polynesiensis TaxID=1325934 RepID=UPI000A406218|nr:nucleoside triphosphate pyrophosphatase [Actinomyces polynesiensis]
MRRGIPTHLVLASKSPARRATLVAAGITPEVIVSHVDEPAVLAALPGGRAFSGGTTTPADEVLALATAKCRAVAEGLEQGRPALTASAGADRLVVVGCDSMLELDGRMLGKPHRPEVARERIREMRNRAAVLWTGHFAVVLEPAGPGAVRPEGARPGGSALGGSTLGGSTLGGSAPDRAGTDAGPWTQVREIGASASTTVRFGDMSDAEIDAYVDSGEPLKVAGSFTVDGLGGPFVTGIEGDYHSVVGLSLPLLRTMLTEVGVFWPDLWDHRRASSAR